MFFTEAVASVASMVAMPLYIHDHMFIHTYQLTLCGLMLFEFQKLSEEE